MAGGCSSIRASVFLGFILAPLVYGEYPLGARMNLVYMRMAWRNGSLADPI